MFSLSNSEKILEINSPLYSPLQIDDNILLCSFNGEILKYSEGQLKLLSKVDGQIRSIAFDGPRNTYYAADSSRQAVVAINSNDFSEAELVNEYEGMPLEGPNSIIISNKTGNILFTDSGPFGQTHLPNVRGSVFIIDMQQQSIRPIALRFLAGPSGLSFGHDERVLYVSETGKNRILRFYESNEGVYYLSVFHQFHGRFGPTALSVTTRNQILAALFEFNGLAECGCMGVLSSSGQLLQKIELPQCGPEVTGLFLTKQSNEDLMIIITQNGARSNCHRLMVKIESQELVQNP